MTRWYKEYKLYDDNECEMKSGWMKEPVKKVKIENKNSKKGCIEEW